MPYRKVNFRRIVDQIIKVKTIKIKKKHNGFSVWFWRKQRFIHQDTALSLHKGKND